jgi:hypothetical protein
MTRGILKEDYFCFTVLLTTACWFLTSSQRLVGKMGAYLREVGLDGHRLFIFLYLLAH